jgi:hypothetical protein
MGASCPDFEAEAVPERVVAVLSYPVKLEGAMAPLFGHPRLKSPESSESFCMGNKSISGRFIPQTGIRRKK